MQASVWRWPLAVLVVGIVLLTLAPLWMAAVLPSSGWMESLHIGRLLSDVLQDGPDDFHARLWVPTPESAVAYVLAWLGPTLGFDHAMRALTSLALVATVATWWLWLRSTGRASVLLLAALPWLISQPLLHGDVPILVSWPLCFATLALHAQVLQLPHTFSVAALWRWAVMALLIVLVSVTHPVPWLGLAMGLPLLTLLFLPQLGVTRTLATTLLALLAQLPALLVLRPWWRKVLQSVGGWHEFTRGWVTEWWSPSDNFRQLVDFSLDRLSPHALQLRVAQDLPDHAGEFMAFGWLVALTIWAGVSIRERREQALHPEVPVTRPHPQPLLVAAMLLVAYFVVPARLHAPLPLAVVGGQIPSVLAMVAALAIPLNPLQPPRGVVGRTWLALGMFTVIALALPLQAWQTMLLDGTTYGHLEDAYNAIPEGKRVCSITARNDVRRMHVGVHDQIAAWSLILRGGLTQEPAPDAGWTPVVEQPFGHLPLQPRLPEIRLADMGACEYIVVFRDPGVPAQRITTELKALPRIYERGPWEIFLNIRANRWPPPVWMTPANDRMGYCALGLVGLTPPTTVAEHTDAMRARALLGWGQRCSDAPAPVTRVPSPPLQAAPPVPGGAGQPAPTPPPTRPDVRTWPQTDDRPTMRERAGRGR